MASLQKIEAKRKSTGGKGASAKYRWRKQFTLDGKQVTLRLGLMAEKSAIEVSGHIDHLLESRKYKTGTNEATKAWLQSADQSLIVKLNALGLCGLCHNPTIETFVTEFIERKKLTSKSGTVFLIGQVKKQLIDHFGTDKRISEVTRPDAKAHWDWLLSTGGLGINTAKRRLGRVREIFNEAIELGVITSNPFQMRSLPVSVGVGNKHYVEAATIEAVIKHLPADKLEWKLLFAFGRFVGCRMPSEIENLTWDDVNWESNTILLKSPKTEHHEGKSERMVPIFPELVSLLLSQSESVPTGTVYVFPTLRRHANLATTAKKMVTAAGYASWSKFWNSMRASRETDLMDLYGLRKACAWIGNSPAVAMKHYALLRKSDYTDLGSESAEKSAESPARTGENSVPLKQKTLGKPRVCVTETTPHGQQPTRKSLGKTHVLPKSAEKSAELTESDLLDLWRLASPEQREAAIRALGA
jgi:integrase